MKKSYGKEWTQNYKIAPDYYSNGTQTEQYLWRAFYYPVIHRNRKHNYSQRIRDEFRLPEKGDIEIIYTETLLKEPDIELKSSFYIGTVCYSELVESFMPPPINFKEEVKTIIFNKDIRERRDLGQKIIEEACTFLDHDKMLMGPIKNKGKKKITAVVDHLYYMSSKVVENLIEHIFPQVSLRKLEQCKYCYIKLNEKDIVKAVSIPALVWAAEWQAFIDDTNERKEYDDVKENNIDLSAEGLFLSLNQDPYLAGNDMGMTKEDLKILLHINDIGITLTEFMDIVNDFYVLNKPEQL